MQLQKYIRISQVVEWMKCMSNLTDKFVRGINIIYTNYCVFLAVTRSTNVLVWLAVSFRTERIHKLRKKFIHDKFIDGHLITSSMSHTLLINWQMNDILAGLGCLLYWNFLFNTVCLYTLHKANNKMPFLFRYNQNFHIDNKDNHCNNLSTYIGRSHRNVQVCMI